MTPASRLPWTRPGLVLRLVALLMVSEFVRTGLLVSFLPLVAARYGVSPGGVGLIFGLHYLADALAKGPIGLVGERRGLGVLLLSGALLGLGLLLALPHAPVLALALLSAVWGLLYAALWPGVMAAAQQHARPGMTARALAVTSVSVAPAIGLGLLGVGQLMQRAPAVVPGLLLAAQLVALLLALSVARLRLPPAPQAEGGLSWRGWRRVAVLLPAAFAQTLAPGLLATVFYPLLSRLGLHLSGLIWPALLGVSVGLLTLWGAGRLADRFHPRAVLAPGLLLLALAFFLAGLPGLPGRLPLLMGLAGLGYGGFIAGWNGLVGRTLPPQYRAASWGTVMAVEALGYALGPPLGGLLWERYGQAGVFWLGAGVLLLVEGYYLWPGRGVVRGSVEVGSRE